MFCIFLLFFFPCVFCVFSCFLCKNIFFVYKHIFFSHVYVTFFVYSVSLQCIFFDKFFHTSLCVVSFDADTSYMSQQEDTNEKMFSFNVNDWWRRKSEFCTIQCFACLLMYSVYPMFSNTFLIGCVFNSMFFFCNLNGII